MEDSNKSDYSSWNFGLEHILAGTITIAIYMAIVIYFLNIENKSLNDKAKCYKSSLDKSLDNERELIKSIIVIKY